MGCEHADFPVVRTRRVKKMPGEIASDCPLQMSDRHRAGYYEVLDTMCSELQERANGFQEINEIFGFLMPEKFKNMKYDEFENIVTI